MTFASTNPATGTVEARFDSLTRDGIDTAVSAAHAAFRIWRTVDFADRAACMLNAADIVDQRGPADLAPLVTAEMGKPIAQAKAEIAKSANGMRYYAENAARFLAAEPAEAEAVSASVAYRVWKPIGAVLAIMPWNYPVWQVIRFAAPALMAGNTVLLKPAPNMPRTAAWLAQLMIEAGFPPGAFDAIHVEVADIEQVLADPRVRAATLTGSEAAGRSVAALAGRYLKKTVLELGGSDPFLVLPSADLDRAVDVGVQARFQNSGQSCIAAKRFIVHRDVYDEFADHFVARVKSLRVGDPCDVRTDIGPLVSEHARLAQQALVDDALSHGASLLCGGGLIDLPGTWFEPTVLANITDHMRIFSEEAFGPVASLYSAESLDDAIEQANASQFGLAASVWTNDPTEQQRLIEELESGAVFVNGMAASYPQLPFGGVKNSGYGTELSELGMREFCIPKTVWIG